MKPTSPELLSMFVWREFFVADLYTINLVGGVTLTYCSGDQDLNANGLTYSAGGQTGPYFDRKDNKAKCHWKAGTDVDTLTFDVIPGSSVVLGAAFLDAIRTGAFDGAEVVLERVFMPTYGDTSRGTVLYFIGRVGDIEAGRSIATFNVNSHLELLNLSLPRNITQSGCMNNLGDTMCAVNLALPQYNLTGTVAAGSSLGSVNLNLSSGFSAGAFDYGTITFTSGALAGFTATVKSCVSGSPSVAALVGFLPSVPVAGVNINLIMGCDKSWAGVNGCLKFANQPRFRGMPFVPQPQTAL